MLRDGNSDSYCCGNVGYRELIYILYNVNSMSYVLSKLEVTIVACLLCMWPVSAWKDERQDIPSTSSQHTEDELKTPSSLLSCQFLNKNFSS